LFTVTTPVLSAAPTQPRHSWDSPTHHGIPGGYSCINTSYASPGWKFSADFT